MNSSTHIPSPLKHLALAAWLLCAPAAFAAINYLDLNGTTPGFDAGVAGSPYTADLTTTATWSTDTNGVVAPGLFTAAVANGIQIGVVPSDFSGEAITINMSDANNIGNSPGTFQIVSTNVVVTMSGTANCRFNHAFTITVAAGSTLIWTTTANNNGWNFNSEAATFNGAGLMVFNDAFCANDNVATAANINMPGGTIQLSQTKTCNWGTSVAGGLVLTAGTLQWTSATALADTFQAWVASGPVFTINGGTIDNTSGTAGTNNLGAGSYVLGGNFTFAGSSSLSLGANAVTLTNNVIVTNLANTLTLGSLGGAFGLTATGPGTLAISGNDTHTGPITVNSGSLAVGGTITGTSAITLASGTTLSATSFGGTMTSLNLTNATVNVGSFPASGALLTTGSYNTGGSNTFNITSGLPITTYPTTLVLVQAASMSGSSTLRVTLPPVSPAFGYVISNTATQVQLIVTSGPVIATWTGLIPDSNTPNTADWDVGVTLNWVNANGGTAITYSQGDEPTFNDTASTTNVLLTTALQINSLTISNNLKPFNFTGSGGLTGPATLTKQGTNILVINNTGPNTFSNGIVATGGTLLLLDQNDAILGNLTVTNGAKVFLDDSPTPMTGTTAIYSNSLLQIGSNDFNGVLPAGTLALNTGGTLVFDQQQNIYISSPISGGGTLIQSNANSTLNLSGANSGFTGAVFVDQGILQFGAAGCVNGSITISNGATLDVNGIAGTNNVVSVLGSGLNGNGAIINTGGTPTGDEALSFITMAGDTYIGGNGRWDLRTSGSPTLGALTCLSNVPHNLFKIGGNLIGLVNITMAPQVANIDVSDGTLQIAENLTSLGNPTNILSVEGPGIIQLYAMTNKANKIFELNDGSTLDNASGADIVVGQIILGTNTSGGPGSALITIEGTSLTLDGPITGPGSLTIRNTEPLYLAGTNTFTNTFSLTGGTTYLQGSGSIANSAIDVEQGATLDVSELTTAFINTNSVLVDGTLNLGTTLINNFNLLNADGGSLNMGVASQGTPCITVTNFILTETSINLTSLPLTPVLNQPFPIIKFVNFTNNAGAPNVSFPNGGFGSVSINFLNHSIDLTITSTGNSVWTGGSTTDNDWSDAANWGGFAINGGNVIFAGTNRLNNTNDTPVDTQYNELIFAPGAGPFNINGNPITLTTPGGIITNEASIPEVVSLELDFSANTVLSGGSSASAPLIMGGVLSNSGSATALYLNGFGSISNNFGSSGVSNAFILTNGSANWTLLDGTNAIPSATNTQNWGFVLQSGTFNFGSSNSTPVFVSTTANAQADGNDNVVGNLAGQTATFNMVNGSLTLTARMNTAATTSGSTGIYNQTGGTMTINNQFQNDNIGSATGQVNLTGGTFSLTAGTMFVASRGTGTFNISGTAVAKLGLLDVSRGISLPTSGTVNLLPGGSLTVSQISTATANTATPVTGANATFNFNGGTLLASTNSAAFIIDSSAGASLAIPLSLIVKTNGAIINDNGFAIAIEEAIQHDTTITNTIRDGGLTKLGTGTLTLAGLTSLGASTAITNTYNGPTVVSAGTLSVSNATALSNSVSINIASGATLIPNAGTLTLSSNQTLMISGNITGALVDSASSANLGLLYQGVTNSASTALAVSGAVTLAGTTEIGIGATNYDALTSGGVITYGGTLIVSNMPGSSLVAGDTFTLFQGTSYAGSFASITLPTLASTNLLWVTNLSVNGSISVFSTTQPTPPRITGATASGGNIIFSGTNGLASSIFYVLSSTNLSLALTNWAVVSTNTFTAAGSFSVTNPIVKGGPATYFVLKVP